MKSKKALIISTLTLLISLTQVGTMAQNVYTTINNTANVGIGYSNGSTLPEAFNIKRVGSLGQIITGGPGGSTIIIPGISHVAVRLEYQLPNSSTIRNWDIRNNGNFEVFYQNGNITPLSITPTENIFRNNIVKLNDNNTNSKISLHSNHTEGHGIIMDNLPNNLLPFRFRSRIGSQITELMSMQTNGLIRINNRLHVGNQSITTGAHNDYKLCVDGKVVAKQYITTLSNWADFVFDEKYQKPTLYEEQIQIKTYKTLVGVPSENDVKEGRDLAETDVILLRKIEEAYLHIIELNEKIIELENKISSLTK